MKDSHSKNGIDTPMQVVAVFFTPYHIIHEKHGLRSLIMRKIRAVLELM
jgi:hypothetical protein